MEMQKFPSIEQFRSVVRNVKEHVCWAGTDENGEPIFKRNVVLPTIEFRGTVKLHGTNASIGMTKDTTWFQSRNNIITVESDNAGFCNFITDKVEHIRKYFDFSDNKEVVVYGEWCGRGIQKGVAISELDRMFVIFAINLNGEWEDMTNFTSVRVPEYNIYNIMDFNTYNISIDFENTHIAQNEMIKLVEEVECECPVGKAFGVSGIGEGIVFTPTAPEYQHGKFMFKVKGEKHSASKVKTLAEVDVEKIENLNKFVEYAVTDNRLNQGIEFLKEQHLEAIDKNTGVFLRWIVGDVNKEERDTITESGLNEKEVNQAVSKAARVWYFNQLEES